MGKLGPLVADQPAETNGKAMPTPSKRFGNKPAKHKVTVLKNSMTAAEMRESGEQFVSQFGSYMTIQEILDMQATKETSNARVGVEFPDGILF